MYTSIYLINRSGGGKKGGKGIECKCMIASWVQSIISYHPNLLVWCIYFCTFLNTIKLFSSVKLSDPDISKIQDNLSDIRSGNLEKLWPKKTLKCHHIFLITIKNSFIFCYTGNEITSRMLGLVSITNVKPFGFVNLAQPLIVS